MSRPLEYENLVKTGAFKEAASSEASIEQFLRTADEMCAAAKAPLASSARFLLAYEGMFSVVMAVLEFYEVRPGDGAGMTRKDDRQSGHFKVRRRFIKTCGET